MTNLYYYPYAPYADDSRIEEHPLFDLLYPLEKYHPPHKDWANYPTNRCPAMNAYENQSFIIKAPLDITLHYDSIGKCWKSDASPATKTLMMMDDEKSDILQFAFYYLFWQDKPSDTQLFLYDPPLYSLTKLPNYYIASGMIPIGTYTRNTSIGIQLKDNTKPIRMKRGDALATVTAFSSQRIKLIRKQPPQHILDQNTRNLLLKKFCPYTASKQLFSRWL